MQLMGTGKGLMIQTYLQTALYKYLTLYNRGCGEKVVAASSHVRREPPPWTNKSLKRIRKSFPQTFQMSIPITAIIIIIWLFFFLNHGRLFGTHVDIRGAVRSWIKQSTLLCLFTSIWFLGWSVWALFRFLMSEQSGIREHMTYMAWRGLTTWQSMCGLMKYLLEFVFKHTVHVYLQNITLLTVIHFTIFFIQNITFTSTVNETGTVTGRREIHKKGYKKKERKKKHCWGHNQIHSIPAGWDVVCVCFNYLQTNQDSDLIFVSSTLASEFPFQKVLCWKIHQFILHCIHSPQIIQIINTLNKSEHFYTVHNIIVINKEQKSTVFFNNVGLNYLYC